MAHDMANNTLYICYICIHPGTFLYFRVISDICIARKIKIYSNVIFSQYLLTFNILTFCWYMYMAPIWRIVHCVTKRYGAIAFYMYGGLYYIPVQLYVAIIQLYSNRWTTQEIPLLS